MNLRLIGEYILVGVLLVLVFTPLDKQKAFWLKVFEWLINRGKKKPSKNDSKKTERSG